MNQEKKESLKKYTSLYVSADLLERFDALVKREHQSRNARLIMLIERDIELAESSRQGGQGLNSEVKSRN